MSIIIARLPRNATRLAPVLGCRQYSIKKAHKLLQFVRCSPEIQQALERKVPIVALESANLSSADTTQGLPYPANVIYAIKAEQLIRQTGAVPATISIISGMIRVGTMLSFFDRLTFPDSLKVSRRDLPYILGMERMSGGCTVAAAMAIAELVGIKVLATGGIGGVHRAATLMMDISADVSELGRTNVAVVCSGPKPYLDIEGTVEFLETRGVPVATFASDQMEDPRYMRHPNEEMHMMAGQQSAETMMPAFYSHDGRVKSPLVVESAKEAAEIIHASHELGLESGQLFCNPIPRQSEIDIGSIEKSVTLVFKQARKKNKRNKEDIKNIVYQMRKYARGEAVGAEKTLLLNNVRMGAQIAIELSKLEGGPGPVQTPIPEMPKMNNIRRPPPVTSGTEGRSTSSRSEKQGIKWGARGTRGGM